LAQSPVTSSDLPSNALDNQGIRRYRVGPGDVLDVRVFGQQELNSTVEIDEDGNISSLPFVEDPIPAKCRNEKEIQKSITEAYSKYLIKPRVSVRILERRSRQPAVVFGAVRSASRIQMNRRVRLHELLAYAGGVTLGASGTIQIIHTETELCPEPEDILQAMTASLEKPAATSAGLPAAAKVATADKAAGSPRTASQDKNAAFTDSDIGHLQIYQISDVKKGVGKEDPYIRPGDIVIVTEGEPIYITGAVVAPQPIVMKDGMTLARALAMAGGPIRQAKVKEIHVYRQKEGKIGSEDLTFDYEAIRKGKTDDILLKAYDIIDVRQLGTFAPKNLADFFLNSVKGTAGFLPQRILY
ncbi:MAG TPA: polysaccharide biosynthesis/export family protein, partial [Pyrinomonadaceae bacterium]|nr:polysaccharide biosynthesis/export family protein [Pyrinomonadaceae bacterium]